LQLARIEYLSLPKKEGSYRKIATKYKTPELNVNRYNLRKAVLHGIWGKIDSLKTKTVNGGTVWHNQLAYRIQMFSSRSGGKMLPNLLYLWACEEFKAYHRMEWKDVYNSEQPGKN